MSGFALIIGPGADRSTFGHMMRTLRPRGDMQEIVVTEGVLAGAHRLRLGESEEVGQPWLSADGEWLLCCDAEVRNERELRAELCQLGHEFHTDGETEVVLEAFREWGEGAVHRLRGEFALAIVRRATGEVYLARDPLGVRPLYWSRRDGCLHVASEVKALVAVGMPITEVGAGQHGWATSRAVPELRPYLDLDRVGGDQPPIVDADEAAKMVRAAFTDSVRVRVDTDLTVGVLLSGGLGSALTLMHVREQHPDCVAFTIGTPTSDDVTYARSLTRQFGVPHEIIEPRPRDLRLDHIHEAIRMSELTTYQDILDAVVSVPLFARVREMGLKVVLTGDGCAELFGGPAGAIPHRVRALCRTGLQRVDRTSMGQGVRARMPFLDLAMVETALRLPDGLVPRDVLIEAFPNLLPAYIRDRPGNTLSHSSGLHERARLYRPLFARLHRSFGYDLWEPVRRDFDSEGRDLDRALTEANRDYTFTEHARDFVAATRWYADRWRAASPLMNRLPLWRRTVRPPLG